MRNLQKGSAVAWVVITSFLLVLSVLVAPPASGELVSGGTTTVSAAGPSPAISVPDATIDDTSQSNVTIAYNASGNPVGDVALYVSGPNGFSAYTDSTNPPSNFDGQVVANNGTLNLTIPAGTFGGGNVTLNANLLLSGTSAATDDATLSVESNATLAGYSLESSAPVYPGENVTVNATLENPGATTEDFTVAAYYGGRLNASKKVQVPPGGTHAELNVSFPYPSTFGVTVNDESTLKSVTVEDPVSVTGHHLSKTVADKGEDVTVNVTLENQAGSAQSKYVWLWTEDLQQSRTVSVPGGATKNVSFTVSYTGPGEHRIFMAGDGEASVFVLGDSTGTANVSLDRTFLPDTVVERTDSSFVAVVRNDGDASAVQNVTLSVDGSVVDHDEVYVDPGDSGQAFLEHNFSSTGEYEVSIDGGTTSTQNVTVRGQVVKSVSIRKLSGPGSTPPSISAEYQGGFVDLQITNGSRSYDLSTLGADDTTVYEVNLTVHNYTPRVLASSGHVVDWSTSNGSAPDETNVTIRVKPARMDFKTQFQGGHPSSPSEWDSAVKDDKADFGYDAAILLGIGNPRGEFVEADPADLGNMTISTDAQMFAMPTYYPAAGGSSPRLEIPLAAPHETTNGNLNDGFYRAFLPDDLLEAWGVTNPESELNAAYSASSATLNVNEVANGAWVNLTSFHYSSGTVRIEKGSSSGGNTGSTGGSAGSTGSSTSGSDGGATTTTTEATLTPTATATAVQGTAAPTDSTGSSDPTEESTPEPTSTSASGSTESPGQPGFGLAVAVVGLLAAALLARARR